MDVREELYELLHVGLVGRDARKTGRRVLGVVEGDEHLHVLAFGRVDPLRCLGELVATDRRVIGSDVAGDLHVELAPERVGEHLRVLVADADQERGGCLGARSRGAAEGAGDGRAAPRGGPRAQRGRAGWIGGGAFHDAPSNRRAGNSMRKVSGLQDCRAGWPRRSASLGGAGRRSAAEARRARLAPARDRRAAGFGVSRPAQLGSETTRMSTPGSPRRSRISSERSAPSRACASPLGAGGGPISR